MLEPSFTVGLLARFAGGQLHGCPFFFEIQPCVNACVSPGRPRSGAPTIWHGVRTIGVQERL